MIPSLVDWHMLFWVFNVHNKIKSLFECNSSTKKCIFTTILNFLYAIINTFLLARQNHLKYLLFFCVDFMSVCFIHQVNTTSESIYRQNIGIMMSTAGCIRRANCMLYFHLGDPVNGPTSWYPLTAYKDIFNLQKAVVQVSKLNI